jgi:hypothetical protein
LAWHTALRDPGSKIPLQRHVLTVYLHGNWEQVIQRCQVWSLVWREKVLHRLAHPRTRISPEQTALDLFALA